MNTEADALYPLQLCLVFPDREESHVVESAAELQRALAAGNIRSLRILDLAPQSLSHLEILARDMEIRRLIVARLGSAQNSYLTPVLGQIQLHMEF